MKLNRNTQRALEALIAGSEQHTEHLQRLLAKLLHGDPSKQLGSDVQTPKELMAWWNEWAEKLGKPRVTVMSAKRRKGFNARIAAGQWDVKLVNQRLQTLGRLALTGGWFTLDFFLCSENNFAKFIDGNYSSDSILKATAEARADSVDSPHKDKQQVMERHSREFQRVVKKQIQEAEERKAKGLE